MTRLVLPERSSARRLCQIERAAFRDRNTYWTVEDYIRLGGPPIAAVLTDDEIALGFLALQFASDEGEILNLGVVPNARRNGLGRKLTHHGIDLAREMGITKLSLEVAADNDPARNLYEASGFEIVGNRRGYYLRADGLRQDAIVMSLTL
ncbi:MAG: GNAT family N-acetyltransferase [Pseudomonadota bacterium]